MNVHFFLFICSSWKVTEMREARQADQRKSSFLGYAYEQANYSDNKRSK